MHKWVKTDQPNFTINPQVSGINQTETTHSSKVEIKASGIAF